jgi:hypothetical protein
VVLFLFGAYRSLGGAPPTATDSAILLRSLHTQLRASLAALATEIDAPGRRSGESDAARDGRKVSAAVQQTLDRLPPPALLDNRDATARTLLAAAAEDASWAWRMIQAGAVSPAVTAAATALAGHAAECCDHVAPLLAAPPSGEPGERS